METNNSASKTYQIAAHLVESLRADVEKLAKRAKRLNVAPISVEIGAPYPVAYRATNAGDWERCDASFEGARYFDFVDVTITGSAPVLAGWTFCATLEHVAGEAGERLTVLRAVPGIELPRSYRDADPANCDHCKRRILTRKETFVVRHEDGTWAQVGRNCTADFLGGKDPHAVAAQLNALLALHTAAAGYADEGLGGGFGGYCGDPSLREFMGVVAALVRVDGWVSRSAARQMDRWATADAAMYYLTPPPRDSRAADEWAKFRAERPATDADKADAAAAVDYARTTLVDAVEAGDVSDYEHNLSVACRLPSVSRKLAGIVASLLSYYKRAIGAEVERRAAAASQHVGTVGERSFFTLTLVSVKTIESSFGTSYLHSFVDADGNRVKWFSSAKSLAMPDGSSAALVEGQTITLKATVKKHDEYRGIRETVLTRGEVSTPEIAAAAADKAAKAAARKAAKAAKAAAATVAP